MCKAAQSFGRFFFGRFYFSTCKKNKERENKRENGVEI